MQWSRLSSPPRSLPMPEFKIHPAIGIARLGTSSEFFAGPTIPGLAARPAQYRDDQGQLKRQATTFWVYAHDAADPAAQPAKVKVGPGEPVTKIQWTVHVANKKAAWFKFSGLTGANDILN